MPAPVAVEAMVLSTIRYGETSKIVRLATRDLGVQSAIAKGALRPKSRFGAALHLLGLGQAHLIPSRSSDLHTLAAFDVTHLPVGLSRDLERYASALALAEVMLRCAPAAPHPEAFEVLRDAVHDLEGASQTEAAALGLRWLWQLVAVLGHAPSIEVCVLDGAAVALEGQLAFSVPDGGALCGGCARLHPVSTLPEPDRRALEALLAPAGPLPDLDAPHAAAHRRLLARYIRHQVGEGSPLAALDFWEHRPWGHP
jgi:DNA repair protein RecO (recombination protein O)